MVGRFRETTDTDITGAGALYKKKPKKTITFAMGCYKVTGQTGDNRIDERIQKIKDFFDLELKFTYIEKLQWSPMK